MALSFLSTNTELALINTISQSLTLCLPNNPPPGQSVFIKDAAGNSFHSTITLSTTNTYTFDDGSFQKKINSAYGSYQLSFNNSNWYITGGTNFNTMFVSTITTQTISTITISSLTTSFSTLNMVDQTYKSTFGTFNTISSLLYYNNNIVNAGIRTAISQKLNTKHFTPYQIPGLSLWLDGADPNGNGNIPINGASISSWYDKSSNRFSPTQGTLSIQPTYSLTTNQLYFATSNNMLSFTGNSLSLTNNIGFCSIFTVFNLTQPQTSAQRTYIFLANSSSGADRIGFYLTNGSNPDSNLQVGFLGKRLDTELIVGIQTSNIPNNTLTMAICEINYTTNAATIYINGTLSITGTSLFTSGGNTSATNPPAMYINNAPGNMGLYISELLTVTQYYSIAYRQQIEGYLAWKWNIQSNLPATHPYKNAPPQ